MGSWSPSVHFMIRILKHSLQRCCRRLVLSGGYPESWFFHTALPLCGKQGLGLGILFEMGPHIYNLRSGPMRTSWDPSPSERSCTWVEAIPDVSSGTRTHWVQFCREGFGGSGGKKAGTEPAVSTWSTEGHLYPGLLSRRSRQPEGRDDLPPLLCPPVRPQLQCCIQGWSPQCNKDWAYWSGSRGVPWRWEEDWSTFHMRTNWIGVFQPGEEMASGTSHWGLPGPKGN